MKKVLSIAMALVMMVSTMVFSTASAYAADTDLVTISLNGVENDASVLGAINSVNEERAYYGLAPITIDYNLTQLAKMRAKEILIACDSNDTIRPDGSSVASVIDGYEVNTFTLFTTVYNTDSYTIAYKLSDLERASLINSVGIGVFTYKGQSDVSVLYCIASQNVSYAPYTDFTDKAVNASITTTLGNLNPKVYLESDSKYVRYNIKVVAETNGIMSRLVLPADNYTVKSSNSKVMKVKKGIAYPKKSGKYTITASFNSNPNAQVKYNGNATEFKNVAVRSVSASSSKKKQMNVSWSYNIIDAEGYEIQYSTDKNFKKNTTIVTSKGNKNFKKTIKKLKSKKTYYVRVRCYISQGNGERAVSNWSPKAKVKIK